MACRQSSANSRSEVHGLVIQGLALVASKSLPDLVGQAESWLVARDRLAMFNNLKEVSGGLTAGCSISKLLVS